MQARFRRTIRTLALGVGSSVVLAAAAIAAGPLNGKEIRLLFVGDPFAQAMQKTIDQLTAMSGGAINLEVVGYPETRNKTLLNANQSESSYDIVSVDGVWMGEYGTDGVLLDLTDMIPGSSINVEDFPASVWEMGQFEGRQLGIPIQPHPEILFYRKDLFDRDGIKPPETTDELLAAAAHFNKPEEGMYGICWNGARGAPLGQQMVHLLAAFGQKPLSDDMHPQFTTDAAKQAAEYALKLMEYSPPSILNMAWDERVRTLDEGGCSMTYEWGGRAAIFELNPDSPIRGKIGYVAAPHATGAAAVTPTGGWFLGIPANLPEDRVPLAWDTIQWLTSNEMLKFYALNGDGAMPTYTIMRDPELVAIYPAFPTVDKLGQDNLLQSWMRPPVPEFQQMTDILGTVYHDMLAGKLTVDQASEEAQAQMDEVMRQSGYY